VQREIARDQEEESGNDRAVDAEAASLCQACFPSGGSSTTGMRAPHEQTRLRTAHSIRSSLPHARQPR
jgi:hypothetical protein